jgi:hypothetical protein
MITFKKYVLLMERASPILYHYTAMDNAVEIVDSGKMLLTYASQGSPDRRASKKKPFYLSFSRIRHSGYSHGNPFSAVLFEFDGSRLSTRYEVRPFDYWGYSWEMQSKSAIADEQEDRLLSHDSEIPLWKYLRAVHVYVNPSDDRFTELNFKRAGFIKDKCEQNNIPCYVYDDVKSWRLGDKRDTLDVESSEKPEVEKNNWDENYIRKDVMDLVNVLKFIQNPFLMNDENKKTLDTFRPYSMDWKEVLSNRIGNIRKRKEKESRDVLNQLARLERKEKKSIFDLMERAFYLNSYKRKIEDQKMRIGWYMSAILKGNHAGIEKEELGSYIDRYDDNYSKKMFPDNYREEMYLAKIESSRSSYEQAMQHLQNAKEILENMDVEAEAIKRAD